MTTGRLCGVGLTAFALAACGASDDVTLDDPTGTFSTTTSGSTGMGGGGGDTTTTSVGGGATSGTGAGGSTGCTGPADCDDGDECTTDTCDTGSCTHAAIDPDDGNACTTDSCDPATGVVNVAIDPDDGNACTTDSCDPATGVANVAVDPDDGDACTADSCDPATGVANVAIDPDDGNACTTDSCDPATGVANVAVDPDDGNACTADSCDPSTGVANVVIDPDDTDPCTLDVCDPLVGPQNLGEIPLFEEDFADNAAGWTLQGQWAIGTALASTGASGDPGSDHTTTADNGLAGINIGGAATTTAHPFEYLTSPAFSATATTGGSLELSFWRWLNSDYPPFNLLTVEVFDGTQWVVVWDNATQTDFLFDNPAGGGNGWIEYSFDVSLYANAAFQVRFGLEVGSGAIATGSWTVDDVVVREVPYVADGDACTADSCGPGGDVYTPIAISDGDACTTDACDPLLGVSRSDVDPNDANACTLDSCDPTNGVANDPVDPDDMDACTVDSCDPSTGVSNDPVVQDKCDAGVGGEPFVSGCGDACIDTVCAVDSYCCTTDWDAICVGEVFSECDSKVCDASAGTCAHPLCETGPNGSTPLTAGCDMNFGDCVTQICAADPFCCSGDWDSLCVTQVSSVCSLNCN